MIPTGNRNNNDSIKVNGLKTVLGGSIIHDNLDLTIHSGEIFAIVGGSGSGKTTLLRAMILLQSFAEGSISILGKELQNCSEATASWLRQRWGVMFQQSALFSSLTVLENVAFPLHEHTELDEQMIAEIAMLKILLVGLPQDAAAKYPIELSGGMQKRAALARAIVMDPKILFLDEPTAGLDPQGANGLDELVKKLKETLGLTVVMVTHDLDTLWTAVDRVAFLGEGKVIATGAVTELAESTIPMINDYFNGPRGRAARSQSWKQK